MGTETFYEHVLPAPSYGYRVLIAFKGGMRDSTKVAHYYLESNAEVIAKAEENNQTCVDVFHACAAFANKGTRAGSNVAAIKSLWVDIDVGKSPGYDTLQQAITAVRDFRRATGLPQPYLVASGAGLHVYWPMTEAVQPDEWQKVADRLAAAMTHFKVEYDTSRTQDRASILRVPGSRNFKRERPSPVAILKDGVPTPGAVLNSILDDYLTANNVEVAYRATKSNRPSRTDPAVAAANAALSSYPPAHGEFVAKKCAVLNQVAESGGDTSYNVWWMAMGVAKHLADSHETAEHWTRHRADTNHNKHDHLGTMAGWGYGPTTCDKFAEEKGSTCADCKYRGKIKSPIALGRDADEYHEAPVTPPPAPAAVVEAEPWEFGASWLRSYLFKKYKVSVDGQGHFTRQTTDADGNKINVPFCARYWQVMDRVLMADGNWHLEIEYTYPNQPNRRFTIKSSDITAVDRLKVAFGEKEMHLLGKEDVTTTQILLKEFQQQLASRNVETVAHRTMGWVTEDGLMRGELTGEFVLGDMKFARKKEPAKIKLDECVPDKFKAGFGQRGSLDEWVAFINSVYNRPGAEAYQFLICAAFASPLVRLCHSPNWHGMPISLTGDSGAAKTSTAMVATAIYGRPDITKFAMNANTGDTINSLGLKMGVLNNLPFLADEMSDRDADFIANFMYMMTNGSPKDRMLSTGAGLVPNTFGWDTIPFITANDALHERLSEVGNHNIQDATKVRCFEVHLSSESLRTVFADVSSAEFTEFLSNNYGVVGQHWVQKLVNNREKVEGLLRVTRASFQIDEDDSSDIRFYKDLLITIEVAAKLALHFGFIRFDVTNMINWAKTTSKIMRDTVRTKDWDGVASDFIASLHGRTITTKKFSAGRGRRTPEAPIEALPANVIPVARKAIEDGVMYVSATYFAEWAKQRKFSAAFLAQKFRDGGWFVHREGQASPHRLSLGSGCTVARPQGLCYEIDYDRAMSLGDPIPAGSDNVVPITAAIAVTDSVTVQSSDSAGAAVSS